LALVLDKEALKLWDAGTVRALLLLVPVAFYLRRAMPETLNKIRASNARGLAIMRSFPACRVDRLGGRFRPTSRPI